MPSARLRLLQCAGVLIPCLLLAGCDREILEPELVAAGAPNLSLGPGVCLGGLEQLQVAPRRPFALRISYPINLNQQNLKVVALSAGDFDATKIYVPSTTLGNGLGKDVLASNSSTEDANRDGRQDRAFTFKTKELVSAGVLTSSGSSLVMLGNSTTAGAVRGIVPGQTPQIAECYIPAILDVPNPIDRSDAKLWVGVLSTPTFDATTLDPGSVSLGDGLGRAVPRSQFMEEDRNGDGKKDFLFSFKTAELKGAGLLPTSSPAGLVLFGFAADRFPVRAAPGPVAELKLEVTPTSIVLQGLGQTAQIVAEVTSSLGGSHPAAIEFESLDDEIAKVDGTGKVTASGIGKTSIRVKWSSQALEVAVDVQPSSAVIPFGLQVPYPLNLLQTTLWVVALSHADFDATFINPESVTLGDGGGKKVAVKQYYQEDTNGDRRADYYFGFRMSELRQAGVVSGESSPVVLTGELKGSRTAVRGVPGWSTGDFVTFVPAELEFIMGPQIRSGVLTGSWAWFDQNALEKGLEFGNLFPADPVLSDDYLNLLYYDQGLVQYINYYRTGDSRFLAIARKITDSWYRHPAIAGGGGDPSAAPREAALGGLMVRAMDGRPEMWPRITAYTREYFETWVGLRIGNPELYFGVRDGGYMLLYAAWLARVHPDPAVREEFRLKAVMAAEQYYARLQYADGSWRWRENPGSAEIPRMQPFMVGLLLEGMVAVHQLSGSTIVRDAILRSVTNLYQVGFQQDKEAFWYFVYGGVCDPPSPDPGPVSGGGCAASEDGLPAERQLNPLAIHAFGYAYRISGNREFLSWGDRIFNATYADAPGRRATVDFRSKEYNQGYRSAGKYLAWRLGR